jgi:hypothetical protein
VRGGEVDRANTGKRPDQPFEVAARVGERRLGDADVERANRGRGGDVAEPILRLDLGPRDRRERARRERGLAVPPRLQAASATPLSAGTDDRLAVE